MQKPFEIRIQYSEPPLAGLFCRSTRALMVAAFLLFPPCVQAGAQSIKGGGDPQRSENAVPFREMLKHQGLSIETSIVPVDGKARTPGILTEGDEVFVRFRIGDSSTNLPLRGAFPAAWMDLIGTNDITGAKTCQQRVQRFLGGGIFAKSELDLNVYYVLALNADPTITVVDPLFGFGGSKLLDLISLQSAGEDWEITNDQDWLFVSMPETDRVAVIQTRSWSVTANINAGPRPTRLALQPDQAYLWVAVDESNPETSGVSVLRLRDRAVVGHIKTGAGTHDIAFTRDSRYAFITNRDAGTLSVVDVRTLEKVKDLDAGKAPVSVVFAETAGVVYVASEADGLITAIDSRSLKQIARMEAKPGIVQVRIPPGGRFGFVPNPLNNTVSIFDLSNNRIVQTASVLEGPDQISFTDELAYVRHRGSEVVLVLPLKEIGVEGQAVPVIDFPGGQHPLGQTSRPSLADAIVQASGAYAALITNPKDKAIYYYKEGMAAPMGNFKNYGREPRAALTVERNLRERGAGLYETSVRLRRPGAYQLVLFLDAPRIVHCFDVQVATDPSRKMAATAPGIRIEPLRQDHEFETGKPFKVSFKLTDSTTGEPAESVADMNILVFSPTWQMRRIARHDGAGVYSVDLNIPIEGFFRVLASSQSMRLPFTQQFNLMPAQQ